MIPNVYISNKVSFLAAGFILKLPIFGAPPDTICFEDSIYWEVSCEIIILYILYFFQSDLQVKC